VKYSAAAMLVMPSSPLCGGSFTSSSAARPPRRPKTCATVSASEETVLSGAEAKLVVDRVRPPLDEFDVLLVPEGPGTRSLENDESVTRWLAGFPPNRIAVSVAAGAGVMAALDAGLGVVERLYGVDVARRIARRIELTQRR
jgi:putative intracellular protease/amidase